jgi:hypothetical protein
MLQADSACSLGVRYALAQEIPLLAMTSSLRWSCTVAATTTMPVLRWGMSAAM